MAVQPAPDPALTDRVAAVTGAGSGIGAVIAETLAAAGARVVLIDRDETAAQSRARSIGAGARAIGCDVTDEEQVGRVVDDVARTEGGLDVLVNCAGVADVAPARELALAAWQRTLAVNLTGTFLMCRAAAPHLATSGSGRIVNIGSQAATVALDNHAAYAASKAGVLGLTRVLALEWGPAGVTVNSVSPTVVLTELSIPIWDNPAGEALKAQVPTGRFAQPHEVASAVLFLASPAAAMINGHDLLVDGGYTIR